MGLSARVPSTADTAGFVPEVWTNEVIDEMKKELVCWSSFWTDDVEGFKKGDTFYFPKTTHVSATEVVIGTKANSTNPFNTSKGSLSISNYYEAPVDIDFMTKFQTQAAMDTYAAEEAAYAVALAIDTSVNTLFSSLGGYSTSAYGSDGQEFTDDIMHVLYETLLEADVPWSNISLICDPSTLIDLMKWDKIIAAQYGSIGDVSKGTIGKNVYGAVVKVTNNLTAATTGAYGVLAHKNAIRGVMQMEPSWKEEFKTLHNTRYQAEALWGVAEYRDDFGIPFYTRKA